MYKKLKKDKDQSDINIEKQPMQQAKRAAKKEEYRPRVERRLETQRQQKAAEKALEKQQMDELALKAREEFISKGAADDNLPASSIVPATETLESFLASLPPK